MHTFKENLSTALRFLFSPRGRTGNAAYFCSYAVLFGLGRLYLYAHAAIGKADFGVTPFSKAVIVAGLVMIVVSAAILTRRVHDIGLGAGWVAVTVVLPLLIEFGKVALLFCLLAGLTPGEEGRNAFGPPPRGVKGILLDRRLAALDRAFVKGVLSAAAFNARRAALLNPPRPAASSS